MDANGVMHIMQERITTVSECVTAMTVATGTTAAETMYAVKVVADWNARIKT